jgi:hypothetical protein
MEDTAMTVKPKCIYPIEQDCTVSDLMCALAGLDPSAKIIVSIKTYEDDGEDGDGIIYPQPTEIHEFESKDVEKFYTLECEA